MNFQGRNAYISGGTSGIGLGIARRFASLGANVFVYSIENEAARKRATEEIAGQAAHEGQRFESMHLDVTDRVAVEEKLGQAFDSFGSPDVLVNSAGMGGAVVFEELTYERFDNTIKLNLYGLRNVVAAALPRMRKTGGYIVNVSSMSGIVGVYGYTAYSASKFGAVGFSQSLRSELKPHGIVVSVLCPGQVDTPLLRETDTYKPAQTKALNKNVGVMSADAVALGLLEGMRKNEFLIIPGYPSKFVYTINRLFPRFREWLADRIVRKAGKNT